ncbi:hypothetical protein ACEWY4_024406 [Coilia grayii]|uniref:C-type lectin domain-containing protein n=1 Tax=Coilia grayii TaxID=363190 RepID=A0ABD1J3V8_9TELE
MKVFILATVLCMLLEVIHSAPEPLIVCPSGWIKYGSRCFKLVTSSMSWVSAENHCMSQHGHLASVHSLEEYDFLQTVVQLSGHSVAWLGGFYFEGYWMWIDRAHFYYTNWYSQNSGTSYPCIYLRNSALEVSPTFVREIVACCTVLHNLCLADGDIVEPEAVEEDDDNGPAERVSEAGDAARDHLAAAASAPQHCVAALNKHDYV